MKESSDLFYEAFSLSEKKQYEQGINTFKKYISHNIDSDLVDDALCNIGILHMKLSEFIKALRIFDNVIKHHPNAVLNSESNVKETGKTAAKCHYLSIVCLLELNQKDKIAHHLYCLDKYNDSYVEENSIRKTFKELSVEFINNQI